MTETVVLKSFFVSGTKIANINLVWYHLYVHWTHSRPFDIEEVEMTLSGDATQNLAPVPLWDEFQSGLAQNTVFHTINANPLDPRKIYEVHC